MQKHANLVDLVKSFPTNIYLQNLASIPPRTSLSKFAKKKPNVSIKVRKNIGGRRCDWMPDRDDIASLHGFGESRAPEEDRRDAIDVPDDRRRWTPGDGV